MVLGFGLVGVQVVSIPTIAITYAIDCYKPIAGQIMVISTVCKNTFGVRHLTSCGKVSSNRITVRNDLLLQRLGIDLWVHSTPYDDNGLDRGVFTRWNHSISIFWQEYAQVDSSFEGPQLLNVVKVW